MEIAAKSFEGELAGETLDDAPSATEIDSATGMQSATTVGEVMNRSRGQREKIVHIGDTIQPLGTQPLLKWVTRHTPPLTPPMEENLFRHDRLLSRSLPRLQNS